jgi:hypothetical protein
MPDDRKTGTYAPTSLLSSQGGVSRLHLGYHGHTVLFLVHSPFTRLTHLPHDFFLHVVCFSHSSAAGRLLAAFRLPSIGACSLFETHSIHGEAHQILNQGKNVQPIKSPQVRSFFFDGHAKNCPELAQLFCEPLQRNSS